MQHTVFPGETLYGLAKRYRLSVRQLIEWNPQYATNPGMIRVGDIVRVAPQPPAPKVIEPNYFEVPHGQLTFDAEGSESPPYFSRRPHVPGPWSGVTIGRGYDCRTKTAQEILDDMIFADIDQGVAQQFACAAELSGKDAEQYAASISTLTITPKQQWLLFQRVYYDLRDDVLRICRKKDVVKKYGKTNWDQLPVKVQDVVVDLRYRGDYTSTTRKKVQPILVANDRQAFYSLMSNRDYWVERHHVPEDRFTRRETHLQMVGES